MVHIGKGGLRECLLCGQVMRLLIKYAHVNICIYRDGQRMECIQLSVIEQRLNHALSRSTLNHLLMCYSG
jgi:hypothetical protein